MKLGIPKNQIEVKFGWSIINIVNINCDKLSQFEESISKNRRHPFKELLSLSEAHDTADLLSAISALQLLPENAGRNLRLEAIAHVLAARNAIQGKAATPEAIRNLCNSKVISSFTSAEDPFDNVFVEEFTFHGGSYMVLPGIIEEATFVLRYLTKAIFLSSNAFPAQQFAVESRQMLQAVLMLSHEMCARAGLYRNPQPLGSESRDISFPDLDQLRRLQHAVRFSSNEIEVMLRNKGLSINALARLSMNSGETRLRDFDLESFPLMWRPIVRFGDELVVAIPGMLVGAVRHALIALSLHFGVTVELARRYNSALWDSVVEFLRFTHCESYSAKTPPLQNQYARDGLFTLDSDKVLYTLLLTDPLDNYDVAAPNAVWPNIEASSFIEERLSEVESFVFSKRPAPNELLCLVVIQGAGRSGFAAFGQLFEQTLIMSAADLRTISLLEGGKNLALWKFATASQKAHQRTKIISAGVLDEFAFFRRLDYSYYASDEFRPNLIVIAPGGAGNLRREAFRERDWHAVSSYSPGYVIEVTLLHDTPQVPIYAPASRLGERVAFLVDNLPVPVWVVEPDQKDSAQNSLKSEYAEFADAISFWIWQFAPVLKEVFRDIPARFERVVIELSLTPSPRWHEHVKGEEQPTEEAISVHVDADYATIHITLTPKITGLLRTADNSGERELVRHLLVGIRGLVGPEHGQKLSDNSIQTALDQYAPLGLKKKLFYLDMGKFPELDPRGLPRIRMVQHSDINEILDDVGNYFAEVKKIPVGRILPSKSCEAVNDLVGFCYRALERLVSTLSPRDLLEWLLAYHEAIARASAQSELTIATRIACFSQEPEMVEEVRKQFSDYSEALLASRFLIEYVTARPPRGLRPMSLSVYDRLLALCELIVNYGMVSDVIKFQLAEMEVSMLPSGRFGVSQSQFQTAMQVYSTNYAAWKVSRAPERFRARWREVRKHSDSAQNEIDEATRAEFGYPLSELLDLLTCAMDIGMGDPPITIMKLSEFAVQLAKEMNWSLEKAEGAIAVLSLGPRGEFLAVPPGYRKADIYPWRFGRSLSYLRRPFVLRELESGTEILCGHRHLRDAQKHLAFVCFGGRLQAKSPQMKLLVSKQSNVQSAEFNDKVADLFESIPEMVVRRRVRKLGPLRGSEAPPGDIDVLVADPRVCLLFVGECKDLSFARNPYEMASEVINLIGGEMKGGRKSVVEKHLERVAWAERNKAIILKYLGIVEVKKWRVTSAIIVDHALVAPHLKEVPVTVISYRELEQTLKTESWI